MEGSFCEEALNLSSDRLLDDDGDDMNVCHVGCIIYETEIQGKIHCGAIPEFA